MRMNIVSRCYYCEAYQHETMQYLFLTVPIAQKLWEFFAKSARGFTVTGIHLQQMVIQWWKVKGPSKIRNIYRIVPALILWKL